MMRWFTRLHIFLRSLFNARQAANDIGEELRDHLNQEIESNIRAGMSPEEARFAAQRMVGPISVFKEQCQDHRASSFIENCMRDFRYAIQMLRRTPLFSGIAIVTLALAIGANTFIFTFVENVVLRPLPVSHPQQLASLNWGHMVNMSYPNYVTFRDGNSSFSHLVASRVSIINLSIRPRENFLVWGYEATGNYFQTLGIKAQLGHFFTPAEDDVPEHTLSSSSVIVIGAVILLLIPMYSVKSLNSTAIPSPSLALPPRPSPEPSLSFPATSGFR